MDLVMGPMMDLVMILILVIYYTLYFVKSTFTPPGDGGSDVFPLPPPFNTFNAGYWSADFTSTETLLPIDSDITGHFS